MFRHYQKRIVNINLNILIASLAATIIAVYPVEFIAKHLNSMSAIVLSAFIIDAGADFIVFVFLHRFAYKCNGKGCWIKDLTKIQGQRVILAILFFIISTSSDYIIMELTNVSRGSSFLIAYTFALIVTRITHTIYGLKTGLFKENNIKEKNKKELSKKRK